MARNVSGRVIDENGDGLFEYRVTLGFPGSLFGKGLKSGLTKAHGMFDLNGVRRGGFRSFENNVIVRKLELRRPGHRRPRRRALPRHRRLRGRASLHRRLQGAPQGG